MGKEDDMNPDTDVTHRTVNLFSSDKRFIYFISDVPNLMKKHGIVYTILVMLDILNTCGKMVCSFFGITFLIFFRKINNAVYIYCQNYQMNILS